MSLGNNFTFMGNQYRLIIDDDEYFIDLLFYHRGLQALVAFELNFWDDAFLCKNILLLSAFTEVFPRRNTFWRPA